MRKISVKWPEVSVPGVTVPVSEMTLTAQQTDFINAVMAGGNVCLRARAGTGKTATVIELVDAYHQRWPHREITLCAFNKSAATELNNRLKARGLRSMGVGASTVHALGLKLLRGLNPEVAGDKVKTLIGARGDRLYETHGASIAKLVSYAKLEGFGFFEEISDTSAWYRLADHYDLDNPQVEAAQSIYAESLAMTSVVDFDDMILMPLVMGLRVKYPKDLLIVDEAQDTGRARQALLSKFVKSSGSFVAVGDDRQGIYGFAGAQVDALDQLIDQFRMKVMPLTTCWRCPVKVIERARKLVSDIEWADGAKEGVVREWSSDEKFERTDAILCRNTAPLARKAYELLKKGVGCRVEGREIGKGLLNLVSRWRVKDISLLMTRLDAYQEREVHRAMSKRKEKLAAEVVDRCDTLRALCEGLKTVDELKTRVMELFQDDVTGVLTLCTYHRSKGREWERVFLLDHDLLCPSPWARGWQVQQEKNLAYVAITRAMTELVG